MAKQPLPEPTLPWWVRAACIAWETLTWPVTARRLKAAGFRRTGWMTWESGPQPWDGEPACCRSLIGIMMHGPGCTCEVPGG